MLTLVTGGTGFLGVNLVRLLVSRGRRVRLLVRPKSSRLGLESDLIEFVVGDVTDPGAVREAVRGCEEVYHLAGWVQISPWGLKTARWVNVEGTRNVCAAAMGLGVRRMVHTSSIATIGAGTLDHPASEESDGDHASASTPYYTTKREAEAVVMEYVERGLDAVVVNPTYIVGPWDVKPTSGRILIHVATGRLPGYPRRGGINYVDVRAAALGHLQAMERGKTGQRYILGGENLSFRDYVRRIAAQAGVRPPRIALPYAVMFPFAALGSVAGRVFPDTFRDLNLCILNSAVMEHYVSSQEARDEIAYEVVAIDQAIEDALRWFVEHAYIKRSLPGPAQADTSGTGASAYR